MKVRVLNRLRGKRRRLLLITFGVLVAPLLGGALYQMWSVQREAVRLRHLEGWALADIARHLDRTPAATAGLIKRGMQALRRQLQKIKDEG